MDAMVEKASQTPPGDFVEVGVYQGGSAQRLYELAERLQRRLFLYDTFTGIPFRDEVDSHFVGDFSDASAQQVQRLLPRATVVSGIFPQSAVAMGSVAFVHLDCDQYRSYLQSIEYLLPRMVPGGVMWFDDAPDIPGACKAVTEQFGSRLKLCNGKYYVEI